MKGVQNLYFSIVCILLIVLTVVASLMASAIYKDEQSIKNPYYFCDGDWECCNKDSPDCDTNTLLKSFDGEEVGVSKAAPVTYNPSDRWTEGSPYHQTCILPIINAIKNYSTTGTGSFNFNYLYNKDATAPNDNPSPYYPGCTKSGSEYGNTAPPKPECLNPKLNPWYPVDGDSAKGACSYSSLDVPAAGQTNPTFTSADDPVYKAKLTNTPAGNIGIVGRTFNPSQWSTAQNANYITGLGTGTNYSANGYTCPFTGAKNCGQGGKSTQNYSKNNALINPTT